MRVRVGGGAGCGCAARGSEGEAEGDARAEEHEGCAGCRGGCGRPGGAVSCGASSSWLGIG